jgi:hypothetical protein
MTLGVDHLGCGEDLLAKIAAQVLGGIEIGRKSPVSRLRYGTDFDENGSQTIVVYPG